MAYIGRSPLQGNYTKLDDISSAFNGSATTFPLTAGAVSLTPGSAEQALISLGGVIQEPITSYLITDSNITFSTAPPANTTFFGVVYGQMYDIGVPSDGTVTSTKIADNSIITSKIASGAITSDKINVNLGRGLAKAYIVSSDTTIISSLNISSQTNLGTGANDVNLTTSMANDDYCSSAAARNVTDARAVMTANETVGSFTTITEDFNGSRSTVPRCVVVHGDLA